MSSTLLSFSSSLRISARERCRGIPLPKPCAVGREVSGDRFTTMLFFSIVQKALDPQRFWEGLERAEMLAATYGDGEDGGGASSQETAGHHQPVQHQGARAVAVSHMLSRWLPTKGDSGRQVGTEREGEREGERGRASEREKVVEGEEKASSHRSSGLHACTCPRARPYSVCVCVYCVCMLCVYCVCLCVYVPTLFPTWAASVLSCLLVDRACLWNFRPPQRGTLTCARNLKLISGLAGPRNLRWLRSIMTCPSWGRASKVSLPCVSGGFVKMLMQ